MPLFVIDHCICRSTSNDHTEECHIQRLGRKVHVVGPDDRTIDWNRLAAAAADKWVNAWTVR